MWSLVKCPPLDPDGIPASWFIEPSAPGPGLRRQMFARSLFRRSICWRRATSRSDGLQGHKQSSQRSHHGGTEWKQVSTFIVSIVSVTCSESPHPFHGALFLREHFKRSPLPCATVWLPLRCDPCCWEGGRQLFVCHFSELSWRTVGLPPAINRLWWQDKPVSPTGSVLTHTPTGTRNQSVHVRWVVSNTIQCYSNTCCVCLQRNAPLPLGVVKWQQLTVGLLALITVNPNQRHNISTLDEKKSIYCCY